MKTASRKTLGGTNEELCAGWLNWLRDHGRADLTVHQYGAKCEELIGFLGPTPLAKVTLAQLEAWVARPRIGKGRGQLGADATRAKDVLVCRGLWKWAVAHGHLLTNPTVDLELPRVRNESPKAIDPETWHTFWSSPMLSDTERAVYGLGFFCGLRRDEICRIRVEHFDWDQGMVRGFPRKGDRGKKTSGNLPFVSCARLFAQEHPRLLADSAALLEPLRGLCVDSRNGWLVPWGAEASAKFSSYRGPGGRNGVLGAPARPIPDGMTSPDQINGRLLQVLKRVGLPPRAFSPHALRHSFVTYLLRGGVPLEVVSRLANHSSLDITLRYIRIPDDPLAEMLPKSTSLRGSRW